MASKKKTSDKPPASKPPASTPNLRVEIEAVSVWEPMGHKHGATSHAAGVSIESWNFRPPRDSEPGKYVCSITIVQTPQEHVLADGSTVGVRHGREWNVEGRYMESREFAVDGAPRPRHFFEVKLPADLEERLRESPEDILARSDLFNITPAKSR